MCRCFPAVLHHAPGSMQKTNVEFVNSVNYEIHVEQYFSKFFTGACTKINF